MTPTTEGGTGCISQLTETDKKLVADVVPHPEFMDIEFVQERHPALVAQ